MSGRKPPRLVRTARVDLPVLEASGIAVRQVDGQTQLLLVGDRTAHVASGFYRPDDGFSDWQTIDLSEVEGWPLPSLDSQLEAIAVDGGSLVALMCEEPPIVLVADTSTPKLQTQIRLVAPPGSPLDGHWDDASSRGEGLVLLRGGRLLVAKEKRPRALVEFAPIGSTPRGLSRDDFLAAGEPWDAPAGIVDYAAVAMWRLRGSAKDALGDISALSVASDRSLWLLSDKSRCVARLSLDTPLRPADGEIRHLDKVWRLPKGTEKPEGIAAIDDEHVLVAMDTNSTSDNGLIARRPRE